ncbi:helix-turn-helix transcriptional regulator [Paenibacillus dendritiformis]|uniref:helix-turn-helix domain-containing protein n=1 Tax=Paenibacillus dendritiformis TaxID=130049 RepID=UPI00248AD701|nr:helix-turn-helix transcriptional regulator [Paenibacillus dendritiformis]WGU92069.1 helix-turn-helix transcriptional regulator [Paenibacillus dendritiformis]
MIKFNLDRVLEQRGMTMYQLGKVTGIRPNTISQWVNNEQYRGEGKDVKSISVDVLDRICKVLKCTVGDLIEYVPDGE